MMNKQMVQIGYNVDKMPLGKLSKDNIKRGYGILKELYDEIKTGKKRTDQIVRLTNDFFSYIPHDFGFAHMSTFILDTEQKVKQKIEMLESLTEIKVATTILSEAKSD
jgi:poly [ADP-ribose] polymerase